MKKVFLAVVILPLVFWGNANASFISGSTGVDGPFNPAASPPQVPSGTVINGTTATVPVPTPDGIFNFTTVNVPSGWTVNFTKNAANTPVNFLATGDVTISGTIDVSGGDAGACLPLRGVGGPGGYDGGYGGAQVGPGGNGLGPGGGQGGPSSTYYNAGGGSYGTQGCSTGGNYGAAGTVYGNARIVPFIGGSGGGGTAGVSGRAGWGGTGGGGAVLIASSSSITVTGAILANSGKIYCGNEAGSGSGGAIKLMANSISGNGTLSAVGVWCNGSYGGKGRIRIEATTNNLVTTSDPPYTYGLPGNVFPVNVPVLSITSIAGTNVPSNPTGSYAQPDMLLPSTTTNPIAVVVAANYIPVGTTVTISVIPEYGSATNATTALSGTQSYSTGSANVNLPTQYSNVITAQATFTIQTAMYYNGEKIDKVRVAAAMGKESEAVYITESGKEIKAKELIMAGLLK